MDFTDILNNLGEIRSLYGNFATIETRADKTPCFRVDIIGRINARGRVTPLDQDKEALEEKISQSKDNDVEFIAHNYALFPIWHPSSWNDWDPLHHEGTSHTQTYDRIFKTIQNNKPGRILVVGCGSGGFLSFLQQKGYDAEGIEINEVSVRKATERKLPVRKMALHELQDREVYDCIVEPGVLSAGVVERDYSVACLPLLARALRKEGLLIHAPYSRSLLFSADFSSASLTLEAKCIPKNLFSWDYPKQWYLGRKK